MTQKIFKEFSTGARVDENSVWFYFLRDKENQLSKCKKCDKEIKSHGGSTSGLHTHLRTNHEIDLLKRKSTQDAVSSSASFSSAPLSSAKKPKPLITDFFQNQHDKSLPAVFSRMTALDGLPFSVFATSAELRTSLGARGFVVPKSAATIRNMVVEYANTIRETVISNFTRLRTHGMRFSLTFDEWTSIKNRRYLNVNVHTENEFWNLGLARVVGSLPAGKCIELVQKVLTQFMLNYDEDIVCITTDGASVMQKVGRLSNCDQQFCFVHGIQLGVLDVLYKKPSTSAKTIFKGISNDERSRESEDDDANLTNDDEEDFSDGFQVVMSERDDTIQLTDELQSLIAKVRTIVKLFRCSPTKNDKTLEKYTLDEFGKALPLIFDSKTRWSSLHTMLARFMKLKNCIRKSLIDLQSKIEISDKEFDTISSVVTCLEPVKLAVEALCRNDATLLSADTTLLFMVNYLGDTKLAVKLKAALVRRINERRTSFSSLLHYLHKGHQRYENLDPALSFEHLSESAIVNAIVQLNERLNQRADEPLPSTSVSSDSDSVDSTANLSLKEKLDMAILNVRKCKNKVRLNVSKDLSKTIRKEIAIFKVEGTRGTYLQNTYEYLKTIKPTSVESERVFSASGNFVTKLRSSLEDDTLNALCFLRAYFTKEKNNAK